MRPGQTECPFCEKDFGTNAKLLRHWKTKEALYEHYAWNIKILNEWLNERLIAYECEHSNGSN